MQSFKFAHFIEQLEIPLIQAPMAGISTPDLAATVSNAGGLGSISVGAMTVEEASQAIEKTRSLTPRPFNVNVFCHDPLLLDPATSASWLKALSPLFEEFGAKAPEVLHEIYGSFNQNEAMLELLLDKRPAIVSFHFGLPPQSFILALKQAGIGLIATATNVAEAKQIEQAGVHGVVAQGIEAGGHRGIFNVQDADPKLSTLVLTRILATELRLPIIAAGGIMDGSGMKAALLSGAKAVQLGTAFVACSESAADANYRAALMSEKAYCTELITTISGRPARGFPNTLTKWIKGLGDSQIPPYPFAYDAAKAIQRVARATGSTDFEVQWAGQGAPLIRVLPAAELLRQLKSEFQG